MLGRLALAGALVVALTPDAEACDCVGIEWFSPANEAVDVPTNLRSITYSGYAGGLSLRDDAGTEIDLGAVVPLDGYSSTVSRVDVVGSLLPNTHYVLTSSASGNPPVLTFTTGTTADTTVPATVSVSELRAQYTEWGAGVGDSCGNQHGHLRGSTAATEQGATVYVHITGASIDTTRMIDADAGFYFSTQDCSISLDVTPCADYSVEVWQVDLAGNASPKTTQSVHVLGCPVMESYGDPGCDGYTGPDVCKPYDEPTEPGDDGGDVAPLPDDDGGCATGGASMLGAFALLGLRRRRRCA